MTGAHHGIRRRRRRTSGLALVLVLSIGGCDVAGDDDRPEEDLFAQVSRAVRDLDAGLAAARVTDLRRRSVDGPTSCDEGGRFRGRASGAGYVTDGSTPEEILERIGEVWASDGGEVVDLDGAEDRPTIARRSDDGIRYEARVRTNRMHPLLAIDIRTDCTRVPDGYADPDGLYDDLWDDFRPSVDPDGEQRNDPLDPAPSR